MRRLNLGTAVAGGLIGGYVFWLVAHHFLQTDEPYTSDRVVTLTMLGWALGFLVGIGAFHGPWTWLMGHDQSHEDETFLAGKEQGIGRYFRFTTDHKVVGIQYLVVTMFLLAVGGTLAMMIRTNLIRPDSGFLSPQTYNSVVGLHGLTMIIATIIMVTGPFGNFIVPIMIGARDMAFPRLNALSLWLIVAFVPVLFSAAFLGGIPTGWSGYAPLSDQAPPGMDAYLMAIIIFAISSAIAGANITTTILSMRARGMTWNRTPIFVWGVMASVVLAIPAFPMFMASMVLLGVDRTVEGQFYVASGGGSPWLYANLFWLMGHPEVYVIVLPAVAAIMEFTPVFARKPIFNYNAAVLAIVGIVGLSIMVWAHHMYASGWAPDLNGSVHAHDRAHLDPDRRALPGADRHDLARPDLDDVADDGHVRGAVELHHRRRHRHLPLRRARRLRPARLAVRHRALPLHADGRRADRGDRGAGLLVPEDDRQDAERAGRLHLVLAGPDRLQRHVPRDVRRRARRPAPPRRALRQRVRRREPGLQLGAYAIGLGMLVLLYAVVSSWRHGADRAGQPVGREDPRVDGAQPDPPGQLRGPPGRHRRPVRIRRGGCAALPAAARRANR